MKFFKKNFLKIILLIIILNFIYFIFSPNLFFVQKNFIDLSEYFEKTNLSDKDYIDIYKQTGLSPYIAKKLLNDKKDEDIIELQKLYSNKPVISKEFIFFPTTLEEVNKGKTADIVEIKKGDILISFSTNTLNWRHGHCGLILDDGGSILEHASIGSTSFITNYKNWEEYANFIVLRYKDEIVAEMAAEYAKENLVDIKYSIFSGIINKDMSAMEEIEHSHCSHIVWQAFKAVGVDLDYNDGLLVTPKDISKSEKLNVIQVFGLNPDNFINRIMY